MRRRYEVTRSGLIVIGMAVCFELVAVALLVAVVML